MARLRSGHVPTVAYLNGARCGRTLERDAIRCLQTLRRREVYDDIQAITAAE